MNFVKKHRFTMIISCLIVILIIVSFYMFWVHIPYATNENRLTSIKNEITVTNGYKYEDYFNEYNSKSVYYILKVSKDKKSQYVAYDKNIKYLDSYEGEVIDLQVCVNEFKNKYEVEPTRTEIGYENNGFVYCLTYQGKGTLIYAFYQLESGQFVKAYQL